MKREQEAIAFLKNAEKVRDYLGASYIIDGEQVMCDGVSCISLYNAGEIPLKVRDEITPISIKGRNLSEAVKEVNRKNNGMEIYISARMIGSFIKERRADLKRALANGEPFPYCECIGPRRSPLFEIGGASGVFLDSSRLLRVMRIISTWKSLCRIVAGEKRTDPVGVSGEFGRALIMPVIKR